MKALILVLRKRSRFFLNSLIELEDILEWSSWFHLLTTLSVKKYLRKSVLHLCFISFSLCPRVVTLCLSSNKLGNSMLDLPVYILYTSISSALLRLSSSNQRPSLCKRASYCRSLSSGKSRVNLCC